MNSNRIKKRLIATLKQGNSGVLTLVNAFKDYDADSNGSLSWEEFCNALKKAGLNLSPQDTRSLFIDMDKDGNNEISFHEFLDSLRDQLSNNRRELIVNIFRGIDSDGDGVISMSDIGACFNPKNHPDVRAGKKPVPLLLKEFFSTFSTVTDTGLVTLDQFLEYYANIAAFDDDETFAEVMSSVWNISNAVKSSQPKTLQSLLDRQTASMPSVEGILQTFKDVLVSRGALGIIGIQRKFRIIDDDGSKTLSFSEFKKAVRESALNFSDIELSQLFNFFDKDKDGSISFDEFLVALRGTLNPRRKALVDMAFKILDKTGRGVVEPEDIIGVYDASKHPDVLAGKRTPNDVLREFLETFDVGGEIDGKVTLDEFHNYYANISACIDDDDYFELMIRNAWHISGGQGWSANSSNKRVLATRADGSQYVEEIKNDLGLKQGDKAGMMARLRAQGSDSIDASSYGGIDNTTKPKKINSLGSSQDSLVLAQKLAKLGLSEKDVAVTKESIDIAKNGPSSGKPKSSNPTAKVFVNAKEIPNAGVLHIVNKLKEVIRSFGGHGFIALQRKFRIIDDDGDKSLSLAEFKKSMKEMNMNLSDSECRLLFDYFDTDRSGKIGFEEFIQALRDPLTERRLRLVEMAFSKLDINGNGIVDGEEIASIYDVSKHPEVLAGRMTPSQALDHFLETFDVGGEIDGKVTKQEFINYYTNIGANIDNEDYFELMIRNAWHISGGEGAAANSANKRVLVTREDGSQYVEEIKNDLGLKQGDKIGMMARLKAQGSLASSISLSDSIDDKSDKVANKPTSLRNLSSTKKATTSLPPPPPEPMRTSSIPTPFSLQRPTSAQLPKALPPPAIPAGLQFILSKLKTEMKSRGALGYIGIQRKFRIMDDNGSKTLDLSEFKKAMKEMNLGLSDTELRMLFDYFDDDHSGAVDFEEFIRGFREPLTERRLALVDMAFSKLDRDGNGVVDGAEIATMYDASKHPDVISGKSTPEEVLGHFLDTFDVGGEIDGKVTRQEFINYYTNLGASIDNEDYFELMIRNAWHLSGGEGWAANTSNTRVLVTRKDGSQYVEEIKNDLGLKQGDKAGILARLQSQGVDASAVSTHGSIDDMNAPKTGRKMFAKYSTSTIFTQSPTKSPPPKRGPPSGSTVTDAPVGVLLLLSKLKDAMKSRGAHGFIGLQRKFRVIDDDGSRTLSFSEFKKGMKEMDLGFSDGDLRILFNYFDSDGNGSIDFEEFIQGIRDPLSDRRRQLVELAFAKIDLDGNGVVDAQEIASLYDATQHPDVLSGKMTSDEVLTHFLETFDVGGVIDGKVTKQEFINYYTNLGANIDNEDYFELMIRNAWHISGGVGWAENTSNKRVLVTRADGSQYVEEIKNDLGLKQGDKAGIIARLKAQGVDAANVSLFDGGDDNKKVPAKPVVRSAETPVFSKRINNTYKTTMTLGDPSQPPQSKSTKPKKGPKEASHGLQLIIGKLKDEIKSRGGGGFIAVQRKFRIIDDDGDRQLNLSEFKKAMKEMNMGLTDAELRMLFEHFDVDRSGGINFDEFVEGIRDPLTERRLRLVKLAFNVLDVDGDGVIDAEEVIKKYDASRHPDVISKKKTPDQVMTEWMSTFEVGGQVDGAITYEEFVNYYTNIGASIDNEDYFELMIRNAWHISGGEGAAANSANKRVLVTRADGSQYVEEIKNDLGLKQGDKAGMMARLASQGVNATSISLHDGSDDNKVGIGSRPSTAPSQPAKRTPVAAAGSTINLSHNSGEPEPRTRPSTAPAEPKTTKPGVALYDVAQSKNISIILSNLKAQLAQRGAHGIIGIQRKFRIMDDDNSRTLSYSEFKKAIQECSLILNDQELRALFQYFDKDRSGDIDFEEFLQGVRNPMNERRINLVNMAFTVLDKNGNGIIEPDDIIGTYDASKHPDVLAGKKSANEVLREFLDTFDIGGVVDGKVTKEEFLNYYANISSSVDDDDYFELMIRNAWHISGGQGWSANSSNKRVLATRADGSQYVEEIKNDLGLKQGDKAGSMARLRAQGANVSSISFFDDADDSVSEAKSSSRKGTLNTMNNPLLGGSESNDGSVAPGRKYLAQKSQIKLG